MFLPLIQDRSRRESKIHSLWTREPTKKQEQCICKHLHIFLTFAHFFLCCGQNSIFRIVGKDNMRGRHTQCTYGIWMGGWMGLASRGKAFTFFLSVCWICWQHCQSSWVIGVQPIWTLSLLRFTFFFHFQFYLCILYIIFPCQM